jgi:hypothetical protein
MRDVEGCRKKNQVECNVSLERHCVSELSLSRYIVSSAKECYQNCCTLIRKGSAPSDDIRHQCFVYLNCESESSLEQERAHVGLTIRKQMPVETVLPEKTICRIFKSGVPNPENDLIPFAFSEAVFSCSRMSGMRAVRGRHGRVADSVFAELEISIVLARLIQAC